MSSYFQPLPVIRILHFPDLVKILKFWKKGRNMYHCVPEENYHQYTSGPPPISVWEGPNGEAKILTQPSSIKLKKSSVAFSHIFVRYSKLERLAKS